MRSTTKKVMVLAAGLVMFAGGAASAATVGVKAPVAAAARVQAKTAVKHASAHTARMHATKGIVKSVDANTLVITRTGKMHREMTFVISADTHQEGTLAVGTPVAVRYREDGKTYIATAVTAQPTKQQAAQAAPSKR